MSDVPKVFVTIGGDAFDRWSSIEIVQSLDELVPSITLQTLDDRDHPLEIYPYGAGDEILVDVQLPNNRDPERVLTGYLQKPEITDDPDQGLESRLMGVSKTVDLVECHVDPPLCWANVPPLKIAEDVVKPFGIKVGTGFDLGSNIEHLETDPGDTPASVLHRIAELKGAIIQSDSFGNIVFIRPTKDASGTVLEYGKNIIRGTYSGDFSDRFSQYTVYAQRVPTRRYAGAVASGQAIRLVDDDVNRFRPYSEVQTKGYSNKDLEERARHLRNVRAGRSKMYSCDTLNWGHGRFGEEILYRPNTLIDVKHFRVQVDGLLLLTRTSLRAGDTGFRSQLDFVNRNAYDPEQKPTKRRKKKKRGSSTRGFNLGDYW